MGDRDSTRRTPGRMQSPTRSAGGAERPERPPRRGRPSLAALLLAALLLPVAAAAVAQVPPDWGGWGRRAPPPREGLPDRRDGFVFCRLLYSSVRREAGGQGWSTDYPGSDHNFMMRLSQFTATRISRWRDGEPGYAVVRATDPDLFQCPFLFVSDAGTAGFSDDEAARLREFLLKGGFLWADDFWGDRAWAQWSEQIRRILPGSQVIDLWPAHPIFSAYYEVEEVPQIPSIQFWRRSGGRTSERGSESATPYIRGILDEEGRLVMLMTYNTDIADGWEREGEDPRFLDAFSPAAYAVGINAALWAMTH